MPVNEEGWSYREIDPKDLRFDAVLGAGAFGKVYKGWWRGAEVVRTSQSYLIRVLLACSLLIHQAIKTLESVSLESADEETLNEIRGEAQVMAQLGRMIILLFLMDKLNDWSVFRKPSQYRIIYWGGDKESPARIAEERRR